MACLIRQLPSSKIIILTGIGKWIGSITPDLIKEIKQIGGPDISSLIGLDSSDQQQENRDFLLVGRRGLCRYNGIFKVKNFNIDKEIKELFPDFASDPNDCYFEKDVETMVPAQEHHFVHRIDMRLRLLLNNDGRFGASFPTIFQIKPDRGSISGGQQVRISGSNLPMDIKEYANILIAGVTCGNLTILAPGLIQCVTGQNAFVMDVSGNVQIILQDGRRSPVRTCKMYEYYALPQTAFPKLLKQPIVVTNRYVEVAEQIASPLNDTASESMTIEPITTRKKRIFTFD